MGKVVNYTPDDDDLGLFGMGGGGDIPDEYTTSTRNPFTFNMTPAQIESFKAAIASVRAAVQSVGAQASAATHAAAGSIDLKRTLYQTKKSEPVYETRSMRDKRMENEAAQRLLMQVLAWCVTRLGGEVVIPRVVLESKTYYIEQETDPLGQIIIRASENQTEVDGDDEHRDDEDSDPWSA